MSRFPLATVVLVGLNVAIWRLELAAPGACDAFGLVPARFTHTGAVGPLFTSLFLHDPGSVMHLGCNMAFLAVFGALVEGSLGHLGFLALYFVAGVAGGLLHVQVDPSATAPLVGASGAIFGVLAVAGALRPRLLGFVFAFAAIEVFHAFTGTGGNVSAACHLGGFAAGVVAAAALRLIGSEALETA